MSLAPDFDKLSGAMPEIGRSDDPKAVPWADSVVWCAMPTGPGRVYEWIGKEHLHYATWSNGIVSLNVSKESFLSHTLVQMLVQAPLVWIGKNVPTQ